MEIRPFERHTLKTFLKRKAIHIGIVQLFWSEILFAAVLLHRLLSNLTLVSALSVSIQASTGWKAAEVASVSFSVQAMSQL